MFELICGLANVSRSYGRIDKKPLDEAPMTVTVRTTAPTPTLGTPASLTRGCCGNATPVAPKSKPVTLETYERPGVSRDGRTVVLNGWVGRSLPVAVGRPQIEPGGDRRVSTTLTGLVSE